MIYCIEIKKEENKVSELQNSLLEAIGSLADSSAKKVKSPLMVEGEVIALDDASVGLYSIKYLDNIINAYSTNPSLTFSIGEIVYILVPDGDLTKTKFIVSAVTPSSSLYTTSEDNDDYFVISDSLLETLDRISLCTYRTETKVVEVEKANFAELINNYLKDGYRTFGLNVKVKTDITDVRQRVAGNYGLTLYIPTIELNEAGEQIHTSRTFTFDIRNIIGNPYALNEWTNQYLYFTLPDGVEYDDAYEPAVTAFVTDFVQNGDPTIPDDIFMKDLGLYVVEAVPEEAKTGRYINLHASEGRFFLKDVSVKKTITPTLYINGNVSKLDGKNIYWFIEDSSVTLNSSEWTSQGGVGWKCLNPKENVITNDDGTTSFNYNTTIQEIEVLKNDVVTSTQYKCVIVDGDDYSSQTILIENLDSPIVINLYSDKTDNVFIKDTGDINLFCEVEYAEKDPSAALTYNWARYNKAGEMLDNDFYDIVKINEQDGDKYLTQIAFPASYIEDNMNIISCTVYSTKPGESRKILGTKKILLTSMTNSMYNVVIENNDVIYKYDADGDSPRVANYDGPASSAIDSVKPFNFKVYKLDGSELSETEYRFCKTTWSLPKHSMMRFDSSILAMVTREDADYYYIDGNGRLDIIYDIKPSYHAEYANNDVLLKVDFNKTIMYATASAKFLKDGMNGTNGSKYAAVLKYQGYTYGEGDPRGLSRKLRLCYVANDTWYKYDYETASYIPFSDVNFTFSVFKDGEPTTDFAIGGWEMLDPLGTNPFFNMADGKLTVASDWEDATEESTNIVKLKLLVGNDSAAIGDTSEELYVYYPIEITRLNDISYLNMTAKPVIEGGFDSVLYATDGTNPKYNNNTPFECIDGLYVNDVKDYYDYKWYASENLNILSTDDDKTCSIKPITKYDNGVTNNFVKVKLVVGQGKISELENDKQACEDTIEQLQADNSFIDTEKASLEAVSALYKYDAWVNALTDEVITNFLNVKLEINNYLSIGKDKLAEIVEFCSTKEGIEELFDYETIATDSNAEIDALRNELWKAGFTAYELSDITSITITNVEQIKQTYGFGVFNALSLLVTDYNTNASLYNNRKDSLGDCEDLATYYEENAAFVESLDTAGFLDPTYANNDLHSICANVTNYFNYYTDPQYGIISVEGLNSVLNNFYELLKEYLDNKKICDFRLNYYASKKENNNNEIAKNEEKIEAIDAQLELAESLSYIIHIKPILFRYNTYEMSNINGWDGNKLYTGENDEYLLAPQVGAGVKNTDNTFTGMVMGIRKQSNKSDVGLFGYSRGRQSLFLDALTGKSSFGMSGKGQFIIDPTNDRAELYSGNFYLDPEGTHESGEGMKIDLTTPEIRWGNGNFWVDANGVMHVGGSGKDTDGDLAGWRIGKYELYAEDLKVVLNSKGDGYASDPKLATLATYDEQTGMWLGNSKDKATYIGPDGISIGKKFRADNKGTLELGNLSGAHWKVDSDDYVMLYTQPDDWAEHYDRYYSRTYDAEKHEWVYTKLDEYTAFTPEQFFKYNKRSYIAYATERFLERVPAYDDNNEKMNNPDKSVYIGTDGISLGKKFKVDNEGVIELGNILGKHWKVNGDNYGSYLYYGKIDEPNLGKLESNLQKDTVYLGTDGIMLGNQFEVSAKKGLVKLGDLENEFWTIDAKNGNTYMYYGYNDPDCRYAKLDTGVFSRKNIYIGTNGIRLGYMFMVDSDEGKLRLGDFQKGYYWTSACVDKGGTRNESFLYMSRTKRNNWTFRDADVLANYVDQEQYGAPRHFNDIIMATDGFRVGNALILHNYSGARNKFKGYLMADDFFVGTYNPDGSVTYVPFAEYCSGGGGGNLPLAENTTF